MSVQLTANTGTVNYKHPFITIQIFDNTEFVEEEVNEERKSFNGMQVGFFSGGRDNQLLYMLNRTYNLREFGKPNFKAFGQAAYNVDNALATENCGMYVLNLRPETATFANIVIMVRFKVDGIKSDTEDPGTGQTILPILRISERLRLPLIRKTGCLMTLMSVLTRPAHRSWYIHSIRSTSKMQQRRMSLLPLRWI